LHNPITDLIIIIVIVYILFNFALSV